MRILARRLVLPGGVQQNVVIDLGDDGTLEGLAAGRADAPVDLRLGTVVPALANTHSHAFHRLLRGRTNTGGGDFWHWRTRMYAVASLLDPELMFEVAALVYAEMVAAGYASVGEFHYLHHTEAGRPYPAHDMELALAAAAEQAGIRLTLLDTLYLHGGFGQPLRPDQRRFGDGSVARWLARWYDLRTALHHAHPATTLGAAVHSVRAVSADEIAEAVQGLPHDVPLHAHLSEQPAENDDCRAATGLSPAALLRRAGALSPRTTVVHATHLTDDDVGVLGAAGVFVAMCPTTEGDLGDGLGRARALADAGASITIGSDQNITIDPYEELRLVERGARLASGRRGVFTPGELWTMGTADGHRALGQPAPCTLGQPASCTLGQPASAAADQLAIGSALDIVELDDASARTLGCRPEELVMTASASDVRTVITRGAVRGRPDLDRAARLVAWLDPAVARLDPAVVR
jgi:formiminoglutamate deiminase